uniref:Uncharacterized protein n=1 Tax=viral metagenome TaxID=1070528 RepID=A0A6C0IXL1_9ZZZZ
MAINKFKFVFIGNCNIGKTCVVNRYINGNFLKLFHSTIGSAFINKIMYKDGFQYNIDIWDTAGQERYRSLLPMYYRNSSIVFICFDITESITKIIETINYWVNQVQKYNDNNSRVIILTGTKIDLLNDIILENKLDKLKENFNNHIILTSSKDDIGVNELFNVALDESIRNVKTMTINNNSAENLELIKVNSLKKSIWSTYCSII